MTEFVLVGCTKTKRDGLHLARDLYDASALFRKRRRFVSQRGTPWGILSAKYGFLQPWDLVSEYDAHVRGRGDEWAAFVLRDLLETLQYQQVRQVTILAGSAYVRPLEPELEARGYDVVDWNCGRMPGERMAALDEAVAAGQHRTLTEAAGDAWTDGGDGHD